MQSKDGLISKYMCNY